MISPRVSRQTCQFHNIRIDDRSYRVGAINLWDGMKKLYKETRPYEPAGFVITTTIPLYMSGGNFKIVLQRTASGMITAHAVHPAAGRRGRGTQIDA